MKRILLFLITFFGYGLMAYGQQTISAIGGVFENERIGCQWTVGEVCFGADESSETSSFQVIPGIFSPSEGIISPTGNEHISLGDSPVRLVVVGNRLHISRAEADDLVCRLYSLEGKLLRYVTIHSTEYDFPLPSSRGNIFLIQFVGNEYNQTVKVSAP